MHVPKKYFFLFFFISSLFFNFSCSNHVKKNYSEDDIKTIKTLDKNNIDFIVHFYPFIPEANQKILKQRNKLIKLKSDYPGAITRNRNLGILNKIADKYRLTDSLFYKGLTEDEFLSRMDDLLLRVNIIPEKLVMAQAIIESGWGSSKYAKSINNYFGIHCHTPGCGEPPSAIENPTFWVKSFPGTEACLEEYIWLLNTGFAFEDLRKIRQRLQKENKPLSALELAKGLEKYSEKGSGYIRLVRSIITNYLPRDLEAFTYHYKYEVAS
jgi:Bax protein